MKQILHIFAKDARRFWPEILLSLAITVAFVRLYANQWLPLDTSGRSQAGVGMVQSLSQRFAVALVFLVPLSWWLLISRVIHAERLIGTTQFWLTRPYEWKKLLAAKLIFLLAFLYLPIFIAQCLILVAAGFHPFLYLPGLLYNLLLITGYLVLPLVALASVTSNFARMTLTLLGIFLCIACIFAVALFVGSPGASTPNQGHVPLILALCLCLSVIAVQYATRKVWHARLLLFAFPVLFFCIGAVIPDRVSIERAYPQPANGAGAQPQLEYRPDPHILYGAYSLPAGNRMGIAVPIQATGIAEGDLLILDDVRVAIEAPGGFRWDSAWQSLYGNLHLPVDKKVTANFTMPGAVYKKLKNLPLRVHLTFASTQARAVKATTVPFSGREVTGPDFGICSTALLPLGSVAANIEFSCRSALREAPLTHVSVAWSDPHCAQPQPEPWQGVQNIGWRGAIESDPAQFGISPVVVERFSLTNTGGYLQLQRVPSSCPLPAVTFTQYKLVGRTQTGLSINDYHLPAHQ
jgi:hypothetical protein